MFRSLKSGRVLVSYFVPVLVLVLFLGFLVKARTNEKCETKARAYSIMAPGYICQSCLDGSGDVVLAINLESWKECCWETGNEDCFGRKETECEKNSSPANLKVVLSHNGSNYEQRSWQVTPSGIGAQTFEKDISGIVSRGVGNYKASLFLNDDDTGLYTQFRVMASGENVSIPFWKDVSQSSGNQLSVSAVSRVKAKAKDCIDSKAGCISVAPKCIDINGFSWDGSATNGMNWRAVKLTTPVGTFVLEPNNLVQASMNLEPGTTFQSELFPLIGHTIAAGYTYKWTVRARAQCP